jgi:hypothetical protein
VDIAELDDLVSAADAARRIGCEASAVRQWASRGYRNSEGERTHLEPAGLDPRDRPLYRLIDVLRAARDTRQNAIGRSRLA